VKGDHANGFGCDSSCVPVTKGFTVVCVDEREDAEKLEVSSLVEFDEEVEAVEEEAKSVVFSG